jgi:hypothetical protein
VKARKHVLHNKSNERHFGDDFFVRQCTIPDTESWPQLTFN